MLNSENRQNGSPEIESELAKDVANLYSWANVEDVSYRDFSNQRKTRHIPHVTDADLRKSEGSHVPELSIESQAEVFESSLPTPVEESPFPDVISVAEPPVEVDLPQPVSVHGVSAPAGFFEIGAMAPEESHAPALAIYSLAGGAGKTTVCANLGRIFSAMKEEVLLVDASGSGLLPFYFGATDLRSGLRTFVAPDANYSPLQVIGTNEITKEWLENDVKAAMRKAERTIFDLGPSSMSLLPQILGMCSTVIVPLLPDLNSILSVSRIEASWKAMQSTGTGVADLFYIFNRFDRHDSIDQRARALVERQCGDRLLPITIRDSAEVAKAIASRMTVADHAPGSEVTHDYLELAAWVRKRAPVRTGSRTRMRWSER